MCDEGEGMMDPIQATLESWWNEDPEMRYAEILCGQDLRVCVRLFQVSLGSEYPVKVAEFEAGTMFGAVAGAVSAALDGTEKHA